MDEKVQTSSTSTNERDKTKLAFVGEYQIHDVIRGIVAARLAGADKDRYIGCAQHHLGAAR